MIGNIVEYVHSYGYFDFKALPFSTVDALVLAQFVYLKMESLLPVMMPDQPPCHRAVTLKEMKEDPEAEQLFADSRFEVNNRALFYAMCESNRYGNMKCMYCADHICTENETQFMALTCILSDGSVKVLYRGTDETIIGWKEDFNMAFQYPIPGQEASQAYLERVSQYVKKDFDLIGHSKGGNLAVYAAMCRIESERFTIWMDRDFVPKCTAWEALKKSLIGLRRLFPDFLSWDCFWKTMGNIRWWTVKISDFCSMTRIPGWWTGLILCMLKV